MHLKSKQFADSTATPSAELAVPQLLDLPRSGALEPGTDVHDPVSPEPAELVVERQRDREAGGSVGLLRAQAVTSPGSV